MSYDNIYVVISYFRDGFMVLRGLFLDIKFKCNILDWLGLSWFNYYSN